MVSTLDFPDFNNFQPKTQKAIQKWNELADELNHRAVPSEISVQINELIHEVSASGEERKVRKKIRSAIYKTLQLIQKELKWVPQSHYQNMWLALGMSAFGIPIGVALSASLDNSGLIGIGLPIGLAIGLAVGKSMDDKAKKEGNQLNFKQSL